MRDRLLTAIFLVLLALPLPLDRLLAMRGVELPGRPFARSLGAIALPGDLLDGTAGRKVENRLLNRSYVGRWLTTRYSEAMYLAFRRTPPAVRVGRDRWLFVPGRVSDRPAELWRRIVQADAGAIAAVDARLRRHGAHLRVAIVPDRSRLYPDRAYRAGAQPAARRRFVPALVEALAARGVDAVSLADPLAALRAEGRAPVYRDDHHWTSSAAERAARGVAGRVVPRPIAGPPPSPFLLRWDLHAPSPGSLVRKLGFAPGSALEAPFRGSEPRLLLEGGGRGHGDIPWEAACASYWTSSFGDLGSPYVFANTLGCPVRIVLVRGKGSVAGPRAELARLAESAVDLTGHPVVWEIPEYHLVGPAGAPPRDFTDLEAELAPGVAGARGG